MIEPRNFSRRQKNVLYQLSEGKCAICGAELQDGWHGDHIDPFVDSHFTRLVNGQALCPKCNREKGSQMPYTEFRSFQKLAIDSANNKFLEPLKEGERFKTFVGLIAPGGGKTLMALGIADSLMQLGKIDTVVHVSPRKALARQMEHESRKFFISTPIRKKLNRIEWRNNIFPLIREDTSGYSTTYHSLNSDLGLHLNAIKGRSVLLVLDELQQLGWEEKQREYGYPQNSKFTQAAEEFTQGCKMIIAITGSANRADGRELLFAQYSDPILGEDGKTRKYLQADVEFTYRMGVEEGILKPFEAHLYEGTVDWNKLGNIEQLRISETKNGLWKFLQEPKIWQGMVDEMVEFANEQRRIVSDLLRDLYAAYDIKQAREIKSYLKKRHSIEALIAVSDDGDEAVNNLEEFRRKESKYRALVTVNMAYIGYDCPYISHICALTPNRPEGFAFLDQLTARGLRTIEDIPVEKQTCIFKAPRDPRMVEFTDYLQNESKLGIAQREFKPKGPDIDIPWDPPPFPIDLGYSDGGELGDLFARGYHGDAEETEFKKIEETRRKFDIPNPSTTLIAFMKELGIYSFSENSEQNETQKITEKDRLVDVIAQDDEKKARIKVSQMVWSIAINTLKIKYKTPDPTDDQKRLQASRIWKHLRTLDGKEKLEQCSLNEVYARIQELDKWETRLLSARS